MCALRRRIGGGGIQAKDKLSKIGVQDAVLLPSYELDAHRSVSYTVPEAHWRRYKDARKGIACNRFFVVFGWAAAVS